MRNLIIIIAINALLALHANAMPNEDDAVAQPTPKTCQEFCTMEYSPVCGYNGNCYREYGNKCTYDFEKCSKISNLETVDMSLCELAKKGDHRNYELCSE